ncbi:MAG: hypothetical protein ACJ75B_07140 [Flavisolibacter sp.]
MKCSWFITIFFLSLLTEAQDKNKHPVYTAEVREEIRANYANLLQQVDSNSFRRSVNQWNAMIYFDGTNADQNFLHIIAEKASLQKNIPAAITDSAGILSALYVRYRLQEKVVEVCYDHYPGRETDNTVKNLLASVQRFQWKGIPGNNREDFPDGLYQTGYHELKAEKNSSNLLTIEKEKFSPAKPGGSLNHVVIDSFYCKIQYDEDRYLHSFELTEYKHQKIGNETIARVKTSMKVERKVGDRNEKDLLPDFSSCLPLYRPLSRKERIELISRNILKNTSLETLIQILKQEQQFTSSEEFELQSKLKAALNLYPNFFENLTGILDGMDAQDKRYQRIFKAVLVSENQAAQQYLARFIRKNKDDYSVLRFVLPQMGIGTYVIDSSLLIALADLLQSHESAISNLAALSLSNLSHQYKYNDSNAHAEVNDLLYQHYLNGSKTREDLVHYLHQVGNAGDESKTDFLSSYFSSDDGELRAEAIAASRFIWNEKMDSLLAGQMVKKQNDSVDLANLYEVLRLRFPSLQIRSAIYHILEQNDESKWEIKYKFLEYLLSFADEIPGIKKETTAIAIKDPEASTLLKKLQEFKAWYLQ